MTWTAIGWWTRRENRLTWHLIESEIADRVVTRCGRQMHRETPRGVLIMTEAHPGQACRVCAGKAH